MGRPRGVNVREAHVPGAVLSEAALLGSSLIDLFDRAAGEGLLALVADDPADGAWRQVAGQADAGLAAAGVVGGAYDAHGIALRWLRKAAVRFNVLHAHCQSTTQGGT